MWSQVGLLVLGMSIGIAPSFLVLSLLKFAVGFVQQVIFVVISSSSSSSSSAAAAAAAAAAVVMVVGVIMITISTVAMIMAMAMFPSE